VLPGLPNELIIEILSKTDDNSFNNLCTEPEFISYCSSNSIFSERIYEERARRASFKRYRRDVTKFKPREMSWREFYSRINIDEFEQLNRIAEFYGDRLLYFNVQTREANTFKITLHVLLLGGVGIGETKEEAESNAAKALLHNLARADITFNVKMML
ncbi:MAG: hypothetical protein Solivirus3_1, partial [Solivirus sp.]